MLVSPARLQQFIPLIDPELRDLLNFVDGECSVTEIRDALSAEFGPVPLEVIARYLDDLARVGVLSWER